MKKNEKKLTWQEVLVAANEENNKMKVNKMKEPKRYSCGNGEGMFEDDKNGHWVEYSEHKAIVEALTEQLRKHAVVGRSEQLFCHHDGRYTLKSDGTCCKCHLPPKPMAK